jgi:hypothetical protein
MCIQNGSMWLFFVYIHSFIYNYIYIANYAVYKYMVSLMISIFESTAFYPALPLNYQPLSWLLSFLLSIYKWC